MVNNKIQFAVVREDPAIEINLTKNINAKKVLLVASGGCTAFSLKSTFPDVEITLVDPNQAQLDLIKRKISALKTNGPDFKDIFNIDTDSQSGLNNCGNFESLFKGLRELLFDLVMPKSQFITFFDGHIPNEQFVKELVSNKYWSTAFKLFFSDPLLNTMFGKDATQHAVPGSYPEYFQKVLENGLKNTLAKDNYFLHHIFLGNYVDRKNCLPMYLSNIPSNLDFEFINAPLQNVDNLGQFDLISLSNIFDWMSDTEITKLADLLKNKVASDTTILFRQLNNPSDYYKFFKPEFNFDKDLEDSLLTKDKSLFYSKINVGTRT
ncbi:MAG: DUF3419 family protein [Candidatus Vogelbacteria bacterium]|nr:DUF3419 family protein [Candidatus Vogelbacteria bacterium]